MLRRSLVGLGLFAPSAAWAFCGLYVTEPGKTIHNQGSAVILAHTDGRTTITVAADFTGDVTDFGMLIPIPTTLQEGDVTVVSPDLFGFLDAYTTPKLVSYTCDDMQAVRHDVPSVSIGCGVEYEMNSNPLPRDDTVEVESRFTVGEYEIAVLSAEQGSDLTAWLTANGFAAPQDDRGIVQTYLDNGTHFLAARVVLEALPEGQAWLSPLRFSYAAPILALPIRIGTINAEGAQDLTVYTITSAEDGPTRITNYPEVAPADECLWRPDAANEPLDTFYQRQIAQALGGQAGWWTEYSIETVGVANCDPCTGPAPLYIQDLPQYGWDGALATTTANGTAGGARLTRLHVRYTPEQAVEDLRFDTRGPGLPLEQIRYVQYRRGLEAWFPVCGEDWSDDPPSCDTSEQASVPGGALGVLTLAALLVAGGRRRS